MRFTGRPRCAHLLTRRAGASASPTRTAPRPSGVGSTSSRPPCSSVLGVLRPVRGDLRLVAVADGEQHLLRVIQVAAALAVVLEDPRLDDRVDRTAFLAEPAEDALGEVDVVARRAPRAVGALLGLDRDRERRTNRLAQLARDAALLAVRIPAQCVQAAKARAHRRLLFRELHGHLALEE